MKESTILGLQKDGEADALYDSWSSFLERKLYPTTEAINNVFALAARLKPEIADLNPLIMWNTHYLRELDDSGFIQPVSIEPTNRRDNLPHETLRRRRSSASRRSRPAMACGTDDQTGHGHHRSHRPRLRLFDLPLAPERSLLVSSARRRDGNGLAFFGHHDIRHGSAKARPRAAS